MAISLTQISSLVHQGYCATHFHPCESQKTWWHNPKRRHSISPQPAKSRSLRCKASEYPQPLLLWAIESAEDPDLTFRLVTIAALDVALAVLFISSFANTLHAKDRRKLILPDYSSLESSEGFLGQLGSSVRRFIKKTASSIPTGASIRVLAEQEPAMTAEEGALEDCLVEGLNGEKSLATNFMLLFLTSLKRTWLANTISEAVMTCCQQQKCSLPAAALLLKRISNPKADFKPPLETLMVNSELMEAIAIYSLITVMRAKGLFKWVESMMAFL